jgi:hypothetical protein
MFTMSAKWRPAVGVPWITLCLLNLDEVVVDFLTVVVVPVVDQEGKLVRSERLAPHRGRR